MKSTINEITKDYIMKNPAVKSCLKRGLINYSSLARTIISELDLHVSKEAVLIAARRLQKKLGKENYENKIKESLAASSIQIKNKITILIIDKSINTDALDELQKNARENNGTIYTLEGSDSYTLILDDKVTVKNKLIKSKMIKEINNLALINIESPEDIEYQKGWVAYVTSLFAENDVNISQFLSCWTQTLFVIESADVPKAINFLKF